GAGPPETRGPPDLRVRLRPGRRHPHAPVEHAKHGAAGSAARPAGYSARGHRLHKLKLELIDFDPWTASSARSRKAKSLRPLFTKTIACSPSTTSTRRRRPTCWSSP